MIDHDSMIKCNGMCVTVLSALKSLADVYLFKKPVLNGSARVYGIIYVEQFLMDHVSAKIN